MYPISFGFHNEPEKVQKGNTIPFTNKKTKNSSQGKQTAYPDLHRRIISGVKRNSNTLPQS